MPLSQNIILSQEGFRNASSELLDLKQQTENLRSRLEGLYDDMAGAMQTPVGDAIETVSKSVLLEPIDNMLLIINHMSETLEGILGAEYYDSVFTGYETLNNITF